MAQKRMFDRAIIDTINSIKEIETIKIKSREKHIIYFLLNKNKIVYIGQSSCGVRRAFLHQLGTKEEPEKIFNKIIIFSAPEDKYERCKIEKYLINYYKPICNRKKIYVK